MSDDPFLRPPAGNTDEERDVAWVAVREATDTAKTAAAWLLSDDGAREALCIDESQRINPVDLELTGLQITLPPCERLPRRAPIDDLIRRGGVSAWWRFDISGVIEERPDNEYQVAALRRDILREALDRRAAAADRGPLWWRAQHWAATTLSELGARLHPDDARTVSFPDAGNDARWVSKTIRRRNLDRPEG